jgi:signal transduction histidine kinase
MSNGTIKRYRWNTFLVNLFIDIVIIIILNVLSKMETFEKIKLSLILFGFGILCTLLFSLFLYINYQFSEIRFQVFTMFFLVGSFVGIIVIIMNLLKDDTIYLSLTIPFINLFFLCFYIRIYIWKIDREKYMENKKQKKISENKNKIQI